MCLDCQRFFHGEVICKTCEREELEFAFNDEHEHPWFDEEEPEEEDVEYFGESYVDIEWPYHWPYSYADVV